MVADGAGMCHVLGRDLSPRLSFAAYAGGSVLHLVRPPQSDLVLSLGRDPDGGIDRAQLRIWRVGFSLPEIGAEPPACLRSVPVFSSVPSTATGTASGNGAEPRITCWCVADDLSQIAIGLHDGGVLLLRTSDLLRERAPKFKPLASLSLASMGASALTSDASASPAPSPPVSAVHFCYSHGGHGDRTPTELWVVMPDAVRTVSAAGLRSEACRVLTESGGARPQCSCVADNGQLVLGRDEALYLYGADERGPCFAFGGAKVRCMRCMRALRRPRQAHHHPADLGCCPFPRSQPLACPPPLPATDALC